MILSNIVDFNESQVKRLREIYGGEVTIIESLHDENVCKWEEVKILITFGHQVNKEFLEKCPNLEWIQAFQAGVERFPMEELSKRGIVLTNTVGIHGIPMSEYVLSMILYFARDFPRYMKNQKAHFWDSKNLVDEAYNKVVGILGAGTIGQEIAERLNFLGMKVYGLNTSGNSKPYFSKMYTPSQKLALLRECDYVVLVLPITKETKNFIGEEELSAMKEDACLINIGRGQLVNDNAFIKAVQEKKIRGAALDVFNQEPLPKDSLLWDLENVLITPHAAAHTVRFLERCIDKFEINIKKYLNNNPLENEINLNRGY